MLSANHDKMGDIGGKKENYYCKILLVKIYSKSILTVLYKWHLFIFPVEMESESCQVLTIHLIKTNKIIDLSLLPTC